MVFTFFEMFAEFFSFFGGTIFHKMKLLPYSGMLILTKSVFSNCNISTTHYHCIRMMSDLKLLVLYVQIKYGGFQKIKLFAI